MSVFETKGVWVGANGQATPAAMKGGPLFDAFHGIRRTRDRQLGASKADLGRAYASAVWAYRCIKLRADAVAGVPLVLRDRTGAPIREHPLLTLLTEGSPLVVSLSEMLRATEAAYNIFGVAYWLKVTRMPNGVRWLTWANPQTIDPEVDPQRGVIGYRQTADGQTLHLKTDSVIAFRNFNPLDDLGGLSPLSVALSEINAELNAARFVSAFFANDARPAGLLTTEQPLVASEAERVRTWWQRLFRGADNKWKTGIVGGGLKWQTITFPPQELALSELRAEDRRAICAVFGVPAGLAGAWEATTFATAREQKASFYEDTIIPQLDYYAQVLNSRLLRAHFPDLAAQGAALSFDYDSIEAVSETATEKVERLNKLFEAGVVTRNEVRAEIGLPPVVPAEDGFVFELQSGEAQPSAPTAAGEGNANGQRDPIDLLDTTLEGVKALESQQIQELAKWRRFALKRIRAGKRLRPFRTSLLPADLWVAIDEALREAATVDDVRAIFEAHIDDWQ